MPDSQERIANAVAFARGHLAPVPQLRPAAWHQDRPRRSGEPSTARACVRPGRTGGRPGAGRNHAAQGGRDGRYEARPPGDSGGDLGDRLLLPGGVAGLAEGSARIEHGGLDGHRSGAVIAPDRRGAERAAHLRLVEDAFGVCLGQTRDFHVVR